MQGYCGSYESNTFAFQFDWTNFFFFCNFVRSTKTEKLVSVQSDREKKHPKYFVDGFFPCLLASKFEMLRTSGRSYSRDHQTFPRSLQQGAGPPHFAEFDRQQSRFFVYQLLLIILERQEWICYQEEHSSIGSKDNRTGCSIIRRSLSFKIYFPRNACFETME